MGTKQISSIQVCCAVQKMHQRQARAGRRYQVCLALLKRETGEQRGVCMRAIDREITRGYVEWGIFTSIGWLTPEGVALLSGQQD